MLLRIGVNLNHWKWACSPNCFLKSKGDDEFIYINHKSSHLLDHLSKMYSRKSEATSYLYVLVYSWPFILLWFYPRHLWFDFSKQIYKKMLFPYK